MSLVIQRGDIVWANLDPTIGVEIKKTRPVIVVSNDAINQHSQLAIVVPLTSNVTRLSPSHVLIPRGEGGLSQDSKAVTEQMRGHGSATSRFADRDAGTTLYGPARAGHA